MSHNTVTPSIVARTRLYTVTAEARTLTDRFTGRASTTWTCYAQSPVLGKFHRLGMCFSEQEAAGIVAATVASGLTGSATATAEARLGDEEGGISGALGVRVETASGSAD